MNTVKYLYIGTTFVMLMPFLLLGWIGAEIHMATRLGYHTCKRFYEDMEREKE